MREGLYGGRKCHTGVSSCAPPPGLPLGAASFLTRWTWTQWWPVKAGFTVSLSPACKSAEEPPGFGSFHFGLFTFNCVYGPDFLYISFDFVQLDHSIAIN